jgi:hypothetical protein
MKHMINRTATSIAKPNTYVLLMPQLCLEVFYGKALQRKSSNLVSQQCSEEIAQAQ